MSSPHFTPDELADYQARVRALVDTPEARALCARAWEVMARGDRELAELGIEVPPGESLPLGEMLLAVSRDPEDMTRPEMIEALKGWALLKVAELRLRARVDTGRPVQWSPAMTRAVCAKRFGAPNQRRLTQYLDSIGVAWETVGSKRLIRVDAAKLPPAK